MKIFSKDSLIEELINVRAYGWIKNQRPGNAGGVGNTLEDYLGIEENNLPIPNASEWELKSQRKDTTSLITLFHMEPSPRAIRFVPRVLLPCYGWYHQEAGERYGSEEKSFRQTISGNRRSDRGFMVVVDRESRRVLISFDSKSVDSRHSDWLESVKQSVGLDEISPQPYWGFNDLEHKAGTKLLNCFYVRADVKIENGVEYFKYSEILILQKFSIDGFLEELEAGNAFVDFDARSGHNHGTKFRLQQNRIPFLYEKVDVV
jgi:hypothetical protein